LLFRIEKWAATYLLHVLPDILCLLTPLKQILDFRLIEPMKFENVFLVSNLQHWSKGEVVQGDAAGIDDEKKAVTGTDSVYYCVNLPYPNWR
jgi:hypothetical protein